MSLASFLYIIEFLKIVSQLAKGGPHPMVTLDGKVPEGKLRMAHVQAQGNFSRRPLQ